jgi:hypothetical protein
MIPLAGYLPGVLKVMWNVFFLNKQLARIEVLLPALSTNPELLSKVQKMVGKYAGKVFESRFTGPISTKLRTIMDAKPTSNLSEVSEPPKCMSETSYASPSESDI